MGLLIPLFHTLFFFFLRWLKYMSVWFDVVDIQEKILPGVTHWQSPNYFAYFPSNSSIAGFLGEMLSAGLNIVGFSWITSPAATELETIVLDWLAKALQLPDDFYSTGMVLWVWMRLQTRACDFIWMNLDIKNFNPKQAHRTWNMYLVETHILYDM